jgi:tryptophanyl-tRNA synthetase
MRPTGRLHLGHFFGALSNWLKLQEEYECFFFVADWHALTTHYEDTSSIAENTLQVATDWLAVGLDPAKSTLFVQSQILEHAELHVLLSMITPLSWLERVPTYKEQIENLKDRDLWATRSCNPPTSSCTANQSKNYSSPSAKTKPLTSS